MINVGKVIKLDNEKRKAILAEIESALTKEIFHLQANKQDYLRPHRSKVDFNIFPLHLREYVEDIFLKSIEVGFAVAILEVSIAMNRVLGTDREE